MKKTKLTAYAAPVLPMKVFLLASLFAAGLFYEALSCAAAVFLAVWLCLVGKKAGGLRLPRTVTMLAMGAVAVFYGLTGLWAVDRGMAWLGMVKFLPLPLFCLAAAQLDRAGRDGLLRLLPPAGAVMTLAALVLGQIPAVRELFFVNGRLAGFFQYPNTFALVLLAGVIVLMTDARPLGKRGGGCLLVLLAGVFLSGSRTGLALTALTAVALAAVCRGRRRWLPLGMLILLGAAAGLYGALTKDVSGPGRYLTASVSSSTLLGRLLYDRDALPVILRHPFGLGYLGYSYLQGSFQTGVYSVQNIHNELFQLLLDVGWVPAGLVVFAVARSLLPGRNDAMGRLLTAVICLHSLVDIDMQFVAMGFVLILAMDRTREEPATVRLGMPALAAAGGALACACVYFGAANTLYYAHAYVAAAALYPGYTRAWMALLPRAETPEEMDALADRVLGLNDAVSLAHSAKARAAYAAGDFGTVIRQKERAIELARFDREEYLDYFDMLCVGVELYAQAGDGQSEAYCRDRLAAIPEMLAETERSASALAWRIDDKPELALPEAYQAKLDAILSD